MLVFMVTKGQSIGEENLGINFMFFYKYGACFKCNQSTKLVLVDKFSNWYDLVLPLKVLDTTIIILNIIGLLYSYMILLPCDLLVRGFMCQYCSLQVSLHRIEKWHKSHPMYIIASCV